MFLNHYECLRCGTEWSDSWSCQVDDDCPNCGLRHIAPTESEDADGADDTGDGSGDDAETG